MEKDKNYQQKYPLAHKIRPEKLEDFFGQEDLIEKNSFLFGAIKKDEIPSIILWGPPGSGKTTLANIIAKKTNSEFVQLSAVNSGKKDLLQIIKSAEKNSRSNNIKTILFIDEIHRWNKAQQDTLLPYIENGTLILIGATTENPGFEINSSLASRARILILKRLSKKALVRIIKRGLKEITKENEIEIDEKTIEIIAHLANGDARMALNTLEICSKQSKQISIDLVKKVLQKSHLLYDKNGEEHYNIISALHKSIRGGDAHAGLYWMARMLEGGEDPVYIARRLLRFASEDVGLANNSALILANSVFDACHKLGKPECNVHLAHCVIYLAKAKKSILAYEAYEKAKKDVENFGNLEVPLHIRNAPIKMMEEIGYGKNYKYTPKEDSSTQEYFPDELRERKYF